MPRALINEPDFLLMDEPFGALDYPARLVVQKPLFRLWEHFRPTILFITHDVGEAIFISDRVIPMTKRPRRAKCEAWSKPMRSMRRTEHGPQK